MKKVALLILSITFLLCLVACDQEQKQDHTPEHTHSFGEWSVSEDATCTEDGVRIRCCDCGEKQSEVISATSHNYVNSVCDKCSHVALAAGLYDENDGLLASWDTLVNTYGLNIRKSYNSSYNSAASTSSLCYILNNNPELSTSSKLVIDNSITSIGNFAFYDCDSLTSVVIGNGVISIWDMAFEQCSNLTSVVLGNSIEYIYDGAFFMCNSLTSIVIPDSVIYIGNYAFSRCDSLASVIMGDNVSYIGYEAFYNCSGLTSIAISNSVIYIGSYAFNCDRLASITVDTNNEKYKSIDGNLYTIDGNALIQYAIGKPETEFAIPDGVTTIADGAFYNCSNLTSIVIPASVTFIGGLAFSGCNRLASITVDTNNEKYKSIDGNLYTIDAKTIIHYAVGKPEAEFKIPDGVTSIGDGAFYACPSLTSVVIPDSVTNIDDLAFYYCDKFRDVYYTGSDEEWEAITVGSFNDSLTEATIHYSYTPEN